MMTTHSETIEYPPAIKSKTARGKYKQTILRERPEVLFLDHYKDGRSCNLIFWTDEPYAWLNVISSHYPAIKRAGICNGWKISVLEENDSDTSRITVNLFKNGTAMIQGDLRQFELDFPAMRLRAEKEKEVLASIAPTLGVKPSCSVPAPDRQPDADTDPPLLQHSEALDIMREHFSQMEIELVQIREQLDQQQPTTPTVSDFQAKKEQDSVNSQLREFQQELGRQRRQLDHLSEEVKELRKDRDNCRTELATLREELQDRDRLSLQARLNSTQPPVPTSQIQTTSSQTPTTPAEGQHSPFLEDSPPTQPGADSNPPRVPTSCLHTNIPSQDASHNPAPVQGPASDPPPARSSRPETTTTAPHPDPTAETEQTHTGRRADIILLMDSNGKFLDEKTLFPRHRTEKIWCPNTRRALELLTVPELGSPSHIIIHTGTNDLRSQQDRLADSLRRVIEQASTNFPTSKIVISTLLHRRDFHPHTIHRVNISLSRDCALKPNVFLAHHPTLHLDCLYDNIHLHRNAVPTLARTLKDVALGRSPTTTPRGNHTTQTPRRPPGPPRPPRPSRPPPYIHPRPSERTARPPNPPHHQHHNPQPTPQPTQHWPLRPSQRAPQPGGPIPPLIPTAEPRLQEQQPIGLNYAAAVRGATAPPPSGELKDILHMLNLLCSRLI